MAAAKPSAAAPTTAAAPTASTAAATASPAATATAATASSSSTAAAGGSATAAAASGSAAAGSSSKPNDSKTAPGTTAAGAKSPEAGKPKAKPSTVSAAAAAAGGAQYGAILLKNQLKDLSKNPVDGFSIGLSDDDNIYEWKVMMEGPSGTPYEGGMFRCSLSFPKEYPNKPPVMKFLTPGFWHPNVYPDGKVCISILHEAKEDQFNTQEKMSEKWRPILGVEAVLISVQSMLSDPNFDSPANIDASVEMKKDPAAFKRRIRQLVRKSQELL